MTEATMGKLSLLKSVSGSVYSWAKKVGLQVFGGLIMEKKDELWVVSLTRVMTWILFGHCLYVWSKAMEVADPASGGAVAAVVTAMRDVSQGELYTLWGMLGIAGAKVVGTQVTNTVAAFKGNGE